jgi:hypothetical protein
MKEIIDFLDAQSKMGGSESKATVKKINTKNYLAQETSHYLEERKLKD